MKILLLFLFPICLFAQVEVQNGNLKNKLTIPFAQSIGYFDSKYKQNLSLEKNNKLMQDYVKHHNNQLTTVSPLNPIEERIEYRFDDSMTIAQNLIRSIVHEIFLSKPLKLGK
ncbi:hypothetical protein OBK27_06790 [Empedobacter falsenii]